ncbi:MAG: hypothetical protein LBR51_03885 [Bacteroidales bacterium]|jgi:hypothetical protein|nr:hypothetical protein [Bacteroidales bacterium]
MKRIFILVVFVCTGLSMLVSCSSRPKCPAYGYHSPAGEEVPADMPRV